MNVHIFIICRAQDDSHANTTVENKINKDMIMLPISGNILLYDFAENIHSQRLKIIYNSAGSNSDEKDDSPPEKSLTTPSITYVHPIKFILSMIVLIFFFIFFIFLDAFLNAANRFCQFRTEKKIW